jgi:hypothetical protein
MANSLVIQLDADIIPDQSLGGITLRSNISDLKDQLVGLGAWKPGSYELVTPFEAKYKLGNGEVELYVDIRNGKIFKLAAGKGYKGKFCGNISVGMLVRQAMAVEPRLYYDESNELILCKDVAGLAMEVPEVDPLPETVPDMNIESIIVYATEIDTPKGQRGEW